MKLGEGRAGAKVILIGEHSVVYNRPAIAIPFNGVETLVEVFKTNDKLTIDSMYFKGYLEENNPIIDGVTNLIYTVLDKINESKFGLNFKITSNILGQRGLGSSAAVSIAIIRAIYNSFNLYLSNEELIELSMYAERINHTNPSGLDVYTIVYQKPIFFIKGEGFRVLNINLNGYLLIVDSNLPSQTKIAVAHVASLLKENSIKVNEIFDQLGSLTNKIESYLENNEILKLGNAMNEAQSSLEKIEVSNLLIDKLISDVNNFNVLGSKITGGGMGGSIIVLVKNNEDAIRIKNKLKNKVWIYNLGDLKWW